MIKKISALIIFVFLLTGCTVDYNIYINNSSVEEEIVLNDINFTIQPYTAFFDEEGFNENGVESNGVDYYNINQLNNQATLSYKFDLLDYKRARAPRTCLKSHSLTINDDNTYLLSSSVGFSCFDQFSSMNSIKINVAIDKDYYEVTNSNADSINGNVYTWIVNKGNYDSKSIQLTFNEKVYNIIPGSSNNNYNNNNNTVEDQKEEEKKVSSSLFAIVMLGAFTILFITLVLVVKIKRNKR